MHGWSPSEHLYLRTSITPNDTNCSCSPSKSALKAAVQIVELLLYPLISALHLHLWRDDDRQLLRGSPSCPKGVGPAYMLLLL
eukprot:14683647-Ditylum_brightwellii.AAC.1